MKSRKEEPEKAGNEILSQAEMMEKVLPLILEKGRVFRKSKNVLARRAKGKERIETITADGKETVNQAEEGDYVVKNQTGAEEMYILSPGKFKERYVFLRPSGEDFAEYRPKSRVVALELTKQILDSLNLSVPFFFEAPWKEKMIAKKGDFLVTPPDESEVYRIARKEFFETYEPGTDTEE